jgi:hypothetical protein
MFLKTKLIDTKSSIQWKFEVFTIYIFWFMYYENFDFFKNRYAVFCRFFFFYYFPSVFSIIWKTVEKLKNLPHKLTISDRSLSFTY